jgi:hypothetical protein
VVGGAGIDRLAILGPDASETLTVTLDGANLTTVADGAPIGIEQVSANLVAAPTP